MEWRLGLISPSRSAHGQVFWGSGGNTPGKFFLARLAHCETDFGD